ncbi:MAG: hypothetical protein WAS56_12550 [Saprospiraceae bacterium]|nr:hypothetical protein [Saprospiraceae bacterium]
MKVVLNFLLVSMFLFLPVVNSYSQDKLNEDPKWPDIGLQNSKIEYNLKSTNGDRHTYQIIVSLVVINLGEKITPNRKLNLKLTLGSGFGSTTGYKKTMNKVVTIQALNQDQKQNVVWKFTIATKGEIHCYDFLAEVSQKIPLEFVIDNNKLRNKTDCISLY